MMERESETYFTVFEIPFNVLGIKSRLDIGNLAPDTVIDAIKNQNYYWRTDIETQERDEIQKHSMGQKPTKLPNHIQIAIEYTKDKSSHYTIHAFGFIGRNYIFPININPKMDDVGKAQEAKEDEEFIRKNEIQNRAKAELEKERQLAKERQKEFEKEKERTPEPEEVEKNAAPIKPASSTIAPSYDLSIERLPVEVLMEIFSQLDLKDVSKATLVNKQFHFLLDKGNDLFWRNKFIQHFPHHFEEVSHRGNISWYDEFVRTYKSEYDGFPANLKKAFSLVKDNLIKTEKEIEAVLQALNLSLKEVTRDDKSGFSLLNWAQKNNNQIVLDYYYKIASESDKIKNNVTQRLRWAVLCNQPDVTVISLIKKGADLNSDDAIPPLHIAVNSNNRRLVDLLLNKGANVDVPFAKPRLSTSKTPLFLAIQKGYLDVAHVLTTHGANVNSIRSKRTYLSQAALDGNIEVVKWLLEHGAKIDFPHPDPTEEAPSNALHIVAAKGHVEIFKLLTEQPGANINVASYPLDKTPLDFAIEGGHREIVEFLMAKEAKFNERYESKLRKLLAGNSKEAVSAPTHTNLPSRDKVKVPKANKEEGHLFSTKHQPAKSKSPKPKPVVAPNISGNSGPAFGKFFETVTHIFTTGHENKEENAKKKNPRKK